VLRPRQQGGGVCADGSPPLSYWVEFRPVCGRDWREPGQRLPRSGADSQGQSGRPPTVAGCRRGGESDPCSVLAGACSLLSGRGRRADGRPGLPVPRPPPDPLPEQVVGKMLLGRAASSPESRPNDDARPSGISQPKSRLKIR
jgi:hypothetical protein